MCIVHSGKWQLNGDAAVCSNPDPAAWNLHWGAVPATHFCNKLV